MVKKFLLPLLILILVLSLSISVGAAATSDSKSNSDMAPRWTYIHLISNGLEIDSTGNAAMFSTISCYSGSVNNVTMSNYLQRYVNGSWSTVKNWSQNYNKRDAVWTKSWYVTKGYQYRVLTYFYAYNGSTLLESTSQISNYVHYK